MDMDTTMSADAPLLFDSACQSFACSHTWGLEHIPAITWYFSDEDQVIKQVSV
jgi:hypothetical protein